MMQRPVKRWAVRWNEVPLLIWLALVWAALWRDFSPGTLIFGVVVAFAVTRSFYLPPVELSGRFNIVYAVWFFLRFVWKVVVASVHVLWMAVREGPNIRNAVVAIPLRSRSDLLMTAVGHTLSLVPGSLVVEVDRSSSTLYLHALDVRNADDAERVRQDARASEALLIRMMGTREELDQLNAERSRARRGEA